MLNKYVFGANIDPIDYTETHEIVIIEIPAINEEQARRKLRHLVGDDKEKFWTLHDIDKY